MLVVIDGESITDDHVQVFERTNPDNSLAVVINAQLKKKKQVWFKLVGVNKIKIEMTPAPKWLFDRIKNQSTITINGGVFHCDMDLGKDEKLELRLMGTQFNLTYPVKGGV